MTYRDFIRNICFKYAKGTQTIVLSDFVLDDETAPFDAFKSATVTVTTYRRFLTFFTVSQKVRRAICKQPKRFWYFVDGREFVPLAQIRVLESVDWANREFELLSKVSNQSFSSKSN